jgi:hypothetical protein
MRRLCVLIIAAGWLTLAHASEGAVENLREQALLEYDSGHYVAAMIHFQHAAEAGDARSVEILALMYRFGAQLYGDQVTADAAKSAQFAAMVSDRRLIAVTNPASDRR